MKRLFEALAKTFRTARNMTVGFFAPDVRRREILVEESPRNVERLRKEMEEKGFHAGKVSKNVTLVRRKNGDRIVLFTNNLEQGEKPELPEHFFPENWKIIDRPLQSSRAVGHVAPKESQGRSYMIKTISPFRPAQNLGNTAFTEARILLDLQQRGYQPEIPLAVVFRPGYQPTLVTRYLPATRMASWEEAAKLKKKIVEDGIYPNDLLAMEQQRLLALTSHTPRVNAVHDPKSGTTHPIDTEFYEYFGVNPKPKLRRLPARVLSHPTHADWRTRTWTDPGSPQSFQMELRSYIPARREGGKFKAGTWVPVQEAPNARCKRYGIYNPRTKKWKFPEQIKSMELIHSRLEPYLQINPKTGRVSPSKSLVEEIFFNRQNKPTTVGTHNLKPHDDQKAA